MNLLNQYFTTLAAAMSSTSIFESISLKSLMGLLNVTVSLRNSLLYHFRTPIGLYHHWALRSVTVLNTEGRLLMLAWVCVFWCPSLMTTGNFFEGSKNSDRNVRLSRFLFELLCCCYCCSEIIAVFKAIQSSLIYIIALAQTLF